MPTELRPSPDEGGDPLVRQRALPVHSMPKQEEENPPSQEDEEEGTPPEQRALPAYCMLGRGRTQVPTEARYPSYLPTLF